MKQNKGISQIVVMVIMLVLAIALPLTTTLVQKSQENRSKATGLVPVGYWVSTAGSGIVPKFSSALTPALIANGFLKSDFDCSGDWCLYIGPKKGYESLCYDSGYCISGNCINEKCVSAASTCNGYDRTGCPTNYECRLKTGSGILIPVDYQCVRKDISTSCGYGSTSKMIYTDISFGQSVTGIYTIKTADNFWLEEDGIIGRASNTYQCSSSGWKLTSSSVVEPVQPSNGCGTHANNDVWCEASNPFMCVKSVKIAIAAGSAVCNSSGTWIGSDSGCTAKSGTCVSGTTAVAGSTCTAPTYTGKVQIGFCRSIDSYKLDRRCCVPNANPILFYFDPSKTIDQNCQSTQAYASLALCNTAKNAACFSTLALCQASDDACVLKASGAKCQSTSTACTGGTFANSLCPGDVTIKCCVPNAAPVTPPCTPSGTKTCSPDCPTACGKAASTISTCKDSCGASTTKSCPATAACTVSCTEANWEATLSPTTCPSSGIQNKTWTKTGTCTGGVTKSPETVNCTYNAPSCTYTYSNYGECSSSGVKTRTVISSTPSGCQGNPDLSTSCTYVDPNASAAKISFKFAMDGIKPNPTCIANLGNLKVEVANIPNIATAIQTGIVTPFTAVSGETDEDGNQVFKVENLALSNVFAGVGTRNYVKIKGPFHHKGRMCTNNQTGKLNESAICTINLTSDILYDFTGYTLLSGDIDSNGVINGMDFSKLKTNISDDILCGREGDLNLDSKVNGIDAVILKRALLSVDDE